MASEEYGLFFIRIEATKDIITSPSLITRMSVNLLKPSGLFTYHQARHSEILNSVRFALSVLYGSQSRQ